MPSAVETRDVGGPAAWAVCIAVALAQPACKSRGEEPPPPSMVTSKDAEQEPPQLTWEEQAIASATQVARITADDVRDVEHRDLEIVEAPKFEVRRLGKPKVLAEEKHLRLVGNWPLTPTRGLIAVQSGPGYYDPWLEARLIDLETGDVLATVDTVYRGYYDRVGLAVGEAKVGGHPYAVLIHASDGQLVPLWPAQERDRRFVAIHPTRGDAFVFRDLETSDEEEDVPTLYAHWKDLRVPPPEPDRPLPAPRRMDERSGRSRDSSWLGPTWRDPAAAPTCLSTSSNDPACSKLELGEDVVIRCASESSWGMVDGWRALHDPTSNSPVMVNLEKMEAQYLEVGDYCRVEEVTFDPPRAIVRCDGRKDDFLWSPHVTWRIPYELKLGRTHWDTKRRTCSLTRLAFRGGTSTGSRWLDVIRGRIFSYDAIEQIANSDLDGYVLFEESTAPKRLMVINVEAGHAYAVRLSSAPRACFRFSSSAGMSHVAAVSCVDAHWRTRWMRLVDLRQHVEWVIPSLRDNDIWIMPDQSALVGIPASKGRARVVKWAL